MNDQQRKKISAALKMLMEVIDQEEEKLDNMEENFGDTERYETMQIMKDELQEIADELEDLMWAYGSI